MAAVGDSWLICICKGQPRAIAKPFCRKDFGHSFALRFDPVASEWLIFDPHRTITDVRILKEREIKAVTAFVHDRCIAYEVTKKQHRQGYMPWPIYCVSQIRQLLGMTRPCFTPWGLMLAAQEEWPDGKFCFDTAELFYQTLGREGYRPSL